MLGVRRGDMGTYFRRSQFEPLVSTLLDDPVLADVPKNATVADIDALIGVELGSAMKLTILKLDGTHFGMHAIPLSLHVFDLISLESFSLVCKQGMQAP